MKKFVKPLVIAASVAAVAGIGAVSFAAWENTTTPSKDVTGATAQITLVGIESDTTLNKNIVPFNQVEGYDNTTMTKEFVVELVVTGDDIADKDIVVSHDATLAAGSSFLVKFDTSSTETAAPDKTDYTEIDGTNSKYDITGSETDGKVYAHIILDSEDSDDMNITGIKFTFTLADHA